MDRKCGTGNGETKLKKVKYQNHAFFQQSLETQKIYKFSNF